MHTNLKQSTPGTGKAWRDWPERSEALINTNSQERRWHTYTQTNSFFWPRTTGTNKDSLQRGVNAQRQTWMERSSIIIKQLNKQHCSC